MARLDKSDLQRHREAVRLRAEEENSSESAFVAGIAFGLEATAKGFELEPEHLWTGAEVGAALRRSAENAVIITQEWTA